MSSGPGTPHPSTGGGDNGVDINALEGWLLKKKGAGSTPSVFSMISNDNRRWFKVREVVGTDGSELALCYFTTQRHTEARGWIFLKDVTDISDDGITFTITTPSRSLMMEAHTKAEHRLWLRGIVELCPMANTSKMKTEITVPKRGVGGNYSFQLPTKKIEEGEGKDEPKDRSEEKASSSSSQSDSKDEESKVDKSSSGDSVSGNGDENMEENIVSGGKPRRSSKHKSSSSTHGTEGGRQEDKPSPSVAILRKSQEGSISSQKSDHRKTGFRNGTMPSSATNRLHDHIRKDQEVPYPEEMSSATKPSPQPVVSQLQILESKEQQMDAPRQESAPFSLDDLPTVTLQLPPSHLTSRSLLNLDEKPVSSSKNPNANNKSRDRIREDRREYVDEDIEAIDLNDVVRNNRARRRFDRRRREGRDTAHSDSEEDDTDDQAEDDDDDAGGRVHSKEATAIVNNTVADAPIRKAKDLLGESDEKRRPSMDELIRTHRRSVNLYNDDDEDSIDFKQEMERRKLAIGDEESSPDSVAAESKISESGTKSKPPRPPAGVKPPYAQKVKLDKVPSASATAPVLAVSPSTSAPLSVSGSASSTNQASTGFTRNLTPPRRPGDPGNNVDKNFATEDWDEGSPEIRTVTRSKTSTRVVPGQVGVDAGVRPDTNWLEDDFDS